MKSRVMRVFPLLFVAAVAVVSLLPLFHTGFFPMHDNTQVERVFEMHKSLNDGMFPVRWVSDLGYGYGYPLFNFYGPLAYYGGGLFVFIFSDSLIATKLMISLAMVGSGISMYLLARALWGKLGGVLSAVLYLLAPYHAVDLYVRGDIGELWAYAFIPLTCYGLYQLYKNIQENLQFMAQNSLWKWILVGSVGFGGIILSHNLSAFMLLPFLLAFLLILIVCSERKLRTTYYILLTILLALAITAFYWLPVFAEMKYTNVLSQVGGGADFHKHFVCVSQLWQSQWGFGGSASGCTDGISFMIGKMHILLSVAALGLLPFLRKREKLVVSIVCLVGLLMSVVFMLPLSLPLWESIPQMAFLQYPWRYLLLASFFSSILGGLVGSFLYEKQKVVGVAAGVILLSGLLFTNTKYFQPQQYLSVTSQSYTSSFALQWITSKTSDEYMPKSFLKPTRPEEIPQSLVTSSPQGKVLKEIGKTQEKELHIVLSNPQDVNIHLAYFPGWQAFDNNISIPLRPTNHGMVVSLPAGDHILRLLYVGTMVENVSNFISLTSVCIAILGIIWILRKKHEQST